MDLNTFAERLKYYRELANYSQKELALLIGVSFAAYNKYETRGNEPKIEVLIKIANTLGIDVNTLVGFKTQDVENQNANEIEFVRRVFKDFNNLAEGDNDILYGYLTANQIDGLDRNTKSKITIEIPKEIFIDFIKQSRLYAENNMNINVKRWFNHDFMQYLNNICLEYYKINSTKK